MPYDQTEGVGLGSRVENTGAPLKVSVGDELLGKTLDGLGHPIDNTELATNAHILLKQNHLTHLQEDNR